MEKNRNTETNSRELVFHYCSVETFFSIITNKTLRLSDVVKSNDNMEVMWVKRHLLNMIKNGETFSYDEFTPEIKSVVSEDIYQAKIKEKIEAFFDRKEITSKFFTICFSGSKSEDMLSQWRGYGDDGRGVAIGFDKCILEKTQRKFIRNTDISRISFRKVEYDEEIQERKIRDFWQKQVNVGNEKIESRESKADIGINFELWSVNSFYKLCFEAIFMKNPFFSEENEYRIVYEKEDDDGIKYNEEFVNKMRMKDSKIIIKNGNIVECFDLDMSSLIGELIKKVILGPKCTIQKKDMQMLLKRLGYNKAEVIWSKGSYR